jgi:hypothetical protein
MATTCTSLGDAVVAPVLRTLPTSLALDGAATGSRLRPQHLTQLLEAIRVSLSMMSIFNLSTYRMEMATSPLLSIGKKINLLFLLHSNTGAAMTYDNWRSYFADLTEAIRAQIPANYEIVHNDGNITRNQKLIFSLVCWSRWNKRPRSIRVTSN